MLYHVINACKDHCTTQHESTMFLFIHQDYMTKNIFDNKNMDIKNQNVT